MELSQYLYIKVIVAF